MVIVLIFFYKLRTLTCLHKSSQLIVALVVLVVAAAVDSRCQNSIK